MSDNRHVLWINNKVHSYYLLVCMCHSLVKPMYLNIKCNVSHTLKHTHGHHLHV